MIKEFCDRCGAEIPKQKDRERRILSRWKQRSHTGGVNWVDLWVDIFESKEPIGDPAEKIICEDCYNAFWVWFWKKENEARI